MSRKVMLLATLCAGAMSGVRFAPDDGSASASGSAASEDPAAAALAALQGGDTGDAPAGTAAPAPTKAPRKAKTPDAVDTTGPTDTETGAPEDDTNAAGHYEGFAPSEFELRSTALQMAVMSQAHKPGGPNLSNILGEAGEYLAFLRGPVVA